MYDFYLETPAQLSHLDPRKPLLNKGAQKPTAPPPAIAPYRATEDDFGSVAASMIAGRRKGLRSTILGMPTGAGTASNAANLVAGKSTLGANGTALGSAPVPTSAQAAMNNITPTVASPAVNRKR